MTAASSSGVIFPLISVSIPSLAKTSRPTFCKLSRARTFIPEFSFCLYLRYEDFHRGGRHSRRRTGRSRGVAGGRGMPFFHRNTSGNRGVKQTTFIRRGGESQSPERTGFLGKNWGRGIVSPCPGSPGPFGAGPCFLRKIGCYHTSASFNNLFSCPVTSSPPHQ